MKNIRNLFGLPLIALLLFQCSTARRIKLADKNAATVRMWFEEGWNKNQNEALIEKVFCPDWEDGNPLRSNQTEGIEGIRQSVKFYQQAFANAHFTITHLFASDNHVAIRYEVSATHIGPAFGVPATGKHFTSTGIVLYDMEGGKIKRSWQELDLMGIMRQLKE
ncbi:MAG: ester cyclase [Phycisphaerae bacterium]|nr:ester cyclase [Saprospiraceae bacterium]